MRRKIWWGWRYSLWLVGALFFLFLIVLPATTSYLVAQTGSVSEGLSRYLLFVEDALSCFMLLFGAIWLLLVGGSFASFLNVVAWRIPHGKGILGSSYCPFCNATLKFKDNIPFWGWIKNRGRCSTCRLPISPRYLLVEIALGMIFLSVVLIALLSGGATLPVRPADSLMSANRMLLEPKPELLQIIGLHLTAISTVFVFALIELDRKQISKSVYAFGLLFVVVISLIWPAACLIGFGFPMTGHIWPLSRMQVSMTLLAGTAVGAIVGFLLDRIRIKIIADQPSFAVDDELPFRWVCLPFGMSVVGAFSGWQSTIVVGVIWFLIFLIMYKKQKSVAGLTDYVSSLIWSPHAKLTIALLFHLATWRWLDFWNYDL